MYYILKCILCIVIPQMKKISEMIASPKWTLQKALNSKTLDKMTRNIFINMLTPASRAKKNRD